MIFVGSKSKCCRNVGQASTVQAAGRQALRDRVVQVDPGASQLLAEWESKAAREVGTIRGGGRDLCCARCQGRPQDADAFIESWSPAQEAG
jgi:hypothetical protein